VTLVESVLVLVVYVVVLLVTRELGRAELADLKSLVRR
jgi:hypothetical protein